MPEKNVVQIAVDILQPNPLQPRGEIDEKSLEGLKNSIKIHGIIEPLIIAKTPAGYQIIAGERRWRAAKLLGIQTVPAIIYETSPRQMLEMAIIENLQRKNLNPIDRAKAFQRLRDEFKLSIKEISKRIGKSAPYVVNSIRLLALPDALKDGLLSGLISEGHARALAGIDNTRLIIEAYKEVLKEKASVRKTEEIARKYKEEIKKEAGEENKDQGMDKDQLESLGQEIEKIFNIPSLNVKIHQSKVMTRIEFRIRGNQEKGINLIEKLKNKIFDSKDK